MNDDKLKQIQKLLDAAEGNLHSARNLMRELVGSANVPTINPEEKAKNLNIIEEGRVIEGVYNGESMVGPDGKEYPVPANYASKSKLVEGDVLKLTIAEDGSFIFKQINPIERRKTIGTLVYNDGNYTVTAEGKSYRVLQASVTYYRGEPGDQVTLILPKDHESTWGAVENVIKNPASTQAAPETHPQSEAETEKQEPEVEVLEETNETDSEPNIEFPENKAVDENNLSTEDETIIQNLSNNEEKPAEVPESEETKNETNDQSDDTDKGIKELEI